MAHIGFLLILTMQAAAAGPADPAHQPYVIQLKDGNELYGFWDERTVQGGGKVTVELDEPWMPTRQRKILSLSDVAATFKERDSTTAKRRQKGYEDAGQVLINGSLAVPTAKYELVQRARQMAGLDAAEGEQDADDVEVSGTDVAGAVITAEPGSAPPPLPGFFEQWGAHIGLLLVAVLLTGLVVRMAFLSGD